MSQENDNWKRGRRCTDKLLQPLPLLCNGKRYVPSPSMDRALIWGENLSVMRALPSGMIHLIYADPPFFTQRDYSHLYRLEEAEFSDSWESGIGGYLSWLRPRVVEMRRLLSDSGSIYLHLDWHASHYVKVMMDSIFGYRNFLNEIVWHYKDPAGTVRDRFKKKHDTILLYSKNAGKHTFNMDSVRMEYSKGTIRQGMGGVISFGRPTKLHSLGKVPEDVWEIPIINSQARERLGYPTQKPLRLLETIVKASSSEGDMVADFFCGSGTTAQVAQSLGRRWIAADSNDRAIRTTLQRLSSNDVSEDRLNLLTCGVVTLSHAGRTIESSLSAWATALGIDKGATGAELKRGTAEYGFPWGKVAVSISPFRGLTYSGEKKQGKKLTVAVTGNGRDREESWNFICPVEELNNPFGGKGHGTRSFGVKLPVAPFASVQAREGLPALRLELCPLGNGVPLTAVVHVSAAGKKGGSQVKRLTSDDIASGSFLLPLQIPRCADVSITVEDSGGGRALFTGLIRSRVQLHRSNFSRKRAVA